MISVIRWNKNCLELLDQTKLPLRCVTFRCRNAQGVFKAIRKLIVRGAPVIGVAAAYGVYLGIQRSKTSSSRNLVRKVKKISNYLASSRPTAKNLFWAVERMKKVAHQNSKLSVELLKKRLLQEAKIIQKEEEQNCFLISQWGRNLIRSGDTVLTHCNAGSLATGRYGTALALLYGAKQQGKKIRAIATETRPLLQGARLTTWELKANGIPVTLICDNMVATCMRQGKIKRVVVGADRIARNGDTANKIGTSMIAILAKEHKIPFYVAAPRSTFDFSIPTGKQIPIEERASEEITQGLGRRIAPYGVGVYNPAFDVTPAQYITAFITERGVIRPPFKRTLKKVR